MPTPLRIQNTAHAQHYGFLRKERSVKKEEDPGVFSSEDEEEVEEKNEGVLDMTVKSDGALKVTILDEQENILSTEMDKIDASVHMETLLVSDGCVTDA